MIPVTQTRTGANGNCFSACLASILEIPLSYVPEFSEENEPFLDELAAFLLPFDLFYTQVSPNDPILKHMFSHGEAWHTIEGISPRGGLHACVGLNGRIVHDPHPQDETGRGLKRIECFGLFVSRNVLTASL